MSPLTLGEADVARPPSSDPAFGLGAGAAERLLDIDSGGIGAPTRCPLESNLAPVGIGGGGGGTSLVCAGASGGTVPGSFLVTYVMGNSSRVAAFGAAAFGGGPDW